MVDKNVHNLHRSINVGWQPWATSDIRVPTNRIVGKEDPSDRSGNVSPMARPRWGARDPSSEKRNG